MNNLLSVDWDFFFPVPQSGEDVQLYDWGHSEVMPFMLGPIWMIRAATFLSHGMELPRCRDWERFWERFTFTKDAVLYYAESHVQAANREIRSKIDGHVVNFDAHHDLGYSKSLELDGHLTCENWLAAYAMLYHPVEVVFPSWGEMPHVPEIPGAQVQARLDDGKPVEMPFSRIMVARSGAWTPSWCDEDFQKFLDACPVKKKIDIHKKLKAGAVMPREFQMNEAHSLAGSMRQAMGGLQRVVEAEAEV